MDEGSERRIAQTEGLFRTANEAIERGLWPNEERETVRFRCECGRVACHGVVELTLAEYEEVRADPRHFVVIPGHEAPGVETVVEQRERYLVVSKIGLGGAEADRTDPRS